MRFAKWRAVTVALGAIGMMIAAAPVARAETAAELQAKGEALAKERRFTDAIEMFKVADKLEPNATHICLIALAYSRRELWPQAEVFLARCHELASAGERPPWLPEIDALIAERVAQATVAPVEVTVEPPGVAASLSVSSFLPDETFKPGTQIHLPPGHHVIRASAPGFEDESVAVDIASKSARLVAIRLYRTGTRPRPPRPLSHYLVVGGAATIGAGVVAYGVMGVGWLALRDRSKDNFGGAYQTMYEIGRPVSLSLFALGAGLVIAGLVTRPPHEDVRPAPAPTVSLVPGGGVVGLTWTR